jgi:hypothetical protein
MDLTVVSIAVAVIVGCGAVAWIMESNNLFVPLGFVLLFIMLREQGLLDWVAK